MIKLAIKVFFGWEFDKENHQLNCEVADIGKIRETAEFVKKS